jgi:uncharacterized membrane protein YgaE (UPF0421/DUF939 family)
LRHAPSPKLVDWKKNGNHASPVQQYNTKHGVAWKVETKASLRRQQEQTTQEVASLEQTKKTHLEISRLKQEAKILEEKSHSAHPKTPLTDKEKQEIIKSLIQSFKNNNNSIDHSQTDSRH